MSVELARAASELKDALDKLGIILWKIPPRTGLTRFQTLQFCGLLIDLKREYQFMCWELVFAAEQAVRSYGPQARLYVPWVFECEWDCDIESWRDGYNTFMEEVPDDDPGFDPMFLM